VEADQVINAKEGDVMTFSVITEDSDEAEELKSLNFKLLNISTPIAKSCFETNRLDSDYLIIKKGSFPEGTKFITLNKVTGVLIMSIPECLIAAGANPDFEITMQLEITAVDSSDAQTSKIMNFLIKPRIFAPSFKENYLTNFRNITTYEYGFEKANDPLWTNPFDGLLRSINDEENNFLFG